MKKSSFFVLAMLFASCLFSQQPKKKGAGRAIQLEKKGTTRAVVVGISDYQNENIPDLQYAHRDAEVFVDFLKSKAGGNLIEDQIIFLKNEDATTGQFAAALDWLIDECKEGDRAIIYFSGHGDVETKTAMHLGFLLTYDSPPSTYIAGAFPLFYLQSVVKTLSTEIQAEVVLITDACRAGKLAGSEIDGAQVTTAALSQQFANEIKILSCQPEEYSLEGAQWGGGRGVFSYHLIEGLTGLADRNGDKKVNLLEIENYLEDKVPAETDPQSQIPMTLGSKSTKLVEVDIGLLDRLKARKITELPTLAAISTRGLEEEVLEKLDSTTRAYYHKFKNALAEKRLMLTKARTLNDLKNSIHTENCDHAVCLYEMLLLKEELKPLHRLMKRNLAAALQDEAQQEINAYLAADFQKTKARINNIEYYKRFPLYLNKAADLLGMNHYMYKSLIAKKLYFEAVFIRLENSKGIHSKEKNREAIKKAKEALLNEPHAPYILNEIGANYVLVGDFESAIEYIEKASELAPTWLIPYSNMGAMFNIKGEYEKAEGIFKSVLKKDSTFQIGYYGLGISKYHSGDYENAVFSFSKAVELVPDPSAYLYLGDSYWKLNKTKAAEIAYQKSAELDSTYIPALQELANFYHWSKRYKSAELALEKIIRLSPENHFAFFSLALIKTDTKKLEEAEMNIDKAIALAPNIGGYWMKLAELKAMKGQTDAVFQPFEKGLQLGFENPDMIESNTVFKQLLKNEKYIKLMEKYFPEE